MWVLAVPKRLRYFLQQRRELDPERIVYNRPKPGPGACGPTLDLLDRPRRTGAATATSAC